MRQPDSVVVLGAVQGERVGAILCSVARGDDLYATGIELPITYNTFGKGLAEWW